MAFGYQVLGFGSGGEAESAYIVACGGCQSTDGDYYIHTFSGDGTFNVTGAGLCRAACVGDNKIDYLVIAGGGGSFTSISGGAGAGGYRYSYPTPVACAPQITATVQGYPITVGDGGALGTTGYPGSATPGDDSVFATITSAGGGRGTTTGSDAAGSAGGSGGGWGHQSGVGGVGNCPPTTPSQGNSAGTSQPGVAGGSGGGGGAGGAGTPATPGIYPSNSGPGGPGATNLIAPGYPHGTLLAGGGGGGAYIQGGGSGGPGGGGAGGFPYVNSGAPGTDGMGAGAGGGGMSGPAGGTGGNGVVFLRYRFQN